MQLEIETENDLIDLGAVSAETKGPPGGIYDELGNARQMGLTQE